MLSTASVSCYGYSDIQANELPFGEFAHRALARSGLLARSFDVSGWSAAGLASDDGLNRHSRGQRGWFLENLFGLG